ncbi:MAG TPA: hypothetical protein VK974_13050 [Methylophilaceae bacterium]|nr:hypothetical protein [Methylophilaceae bacterium]
MDEANILMITCRYSLEALVGAKFEQNQKKIVGATGWQAFKNCGFDIAGLSGFCVFCNKPADPTHFAVGGRK